MTLMRQALRQSVRPPTILQHRLEAHFASSEPMQYKFSPSTISYRFCPKLWVLGSMGLIDGYKKFDSRRAADTGTDAHARYETAAREIGAVYNHPVLGPCQEKLLEHPSGIRGRFDAIVEAENPDEDPTLYLTDFKTMKQDKFDFLYAPYDYHLKQMYLYIGMLEDLYTFDRPLKGLYYYEGKSTHAAKEFIVPWGPEERARFDKIVWIIGRTKAAMAAADPDAVPCTCTGKDPCKTWDRDKLAKRPKRVRF